MSDEMKSRRTFLKGSVAAAGLASLKGIAPQTVLGANDTIRAGVIGVGNRGMWGLLEMKKRGTKIAAVCDVYEVRLMEARDASEDDNGQKADAYYEYEKVLERNDLDAVYLAAPDHWHRDMLIDAVQAGKDAYTEKPFSKTIEEGQEMVKAVRETKQIVQVGNHRRSGQHWLKAREWIRSGKLGDIACIKVWDTRDWVTNGDPWSEQVKAGVRGRLDWDRFLGKAPKRPFDPHRYFTWRWYWDYAGGLITDIGAHQLDVNQWLMDVDGPQSVACNGGNHVFDYWETPDVVHAILNYGKFTTLFTVQFVNGRDSVGGAFYGTKGSLLVDDQNGFRIFTPQGAKEPVERWDRPYEGGDHVANFLECIKTRKEPNSPVEVGHQIITSAHLANISYRTGKRIDWDPKNEEMLEVRRIQPTDTWLKSRL
ncbi:MAG: Gfo/Idh/MocA family oxidoreductase [Candidatus Omnitrophica bacterium]|nr:Gfo/Idh/MocA family oxidoreductase [Candidatus Omnitrophota bacterium]